MGRYPDCKDGRYSCLWCKYERARRDCHGAPASNIGYEMWKRGLTARDVAQESGVSSSRISAFLQGKRTINGMNAEAFMAIVRVIGCNPEMLLEDAPARKF